MDSPGLLPTPVVSLSLWLPIRAGVEWESMGRATRREVLATYKERDSWWTVFLVDPVAGRLVQLFSGWRVVTPNLVTLLAFGFGLAAAGAFWQGEWPWLIAGAVAFHCGFILDCVDGKLARVRGQHSLFGGWLDYVCDRVRVLVCALALCGGQYERTGYSAFLYLAVGLVFCDMFRYLNALYLKDTRHAMRSRMAEAAGTTVDQLRLQDESQRELGGVSVESRNSDNGVIVDVQQSFKNRFGWFARFRDALVRHRVRAHLFSGVEFQMAVFIVAPLCGRIVEIPLVAMLLLLLIEAAVTYKAYLSAREVDRRLTA